LTLREVADSCIYEVLEEGVLGEKDRLEEVVNLDILKGYPRVIFIDVEWFVGDRTYVIW
jgi:hypothetical protein